MTILALDLDASRVRAVNGPPGMLPSTWLLQPPRAELPLCLGLQGPVPETGWPALQICRLHPHQVCYNFLPHLGDQEGKRWRSGHHSIDAAGALSLVFQYLQRVARGAGKLVLTMPGYLQQKQVQAVARTLHQLGLPLAGSLTTPLALALQAYVEHPWSGTALVLDIDEHALSLTSVQDADGQAHLLEHFSFPHLGLRVWHNRLLNALADACILQSRRDPRACGGAEQTLFLQLPTLLEESRQGRMVNVSFHTSTWAQNLVLHPNQVATFCTSLTRQVLHEVEKIYHASWPRRPPSVLILSSQVGLLPGVIPALQEAFERWTAASLEQEIMHGGEEDFGENLAGDDPAQSGKLILLGTEAAARGAHTVGCKFLAGELPRCHLDVAVPLPEPQPLEAGPARLHFEGRDYLLRGRAFLLGRQRDCDLVFDWQRFPCVSPLHCEIIYDPSRYLLRDRSREGTWINDLPVDQMQVLHPGDWIRLGPTGPVLRYLGQPENYESIMRPA